MGNVAIFSGIYAKTLKANLDLNGAVQILSGTVNPTSSATTAQAGSLYLNTSSGVVYRKTDNGSSTNWVIVNGTAIQNTAAKTSAYTATSSDDFLTGDATSAAFTFTLPAAASNTGKIFEFMKIDSSLANAITIDGNGSETIDGALTAKLCTQYESITIISNGTNWNTLTRKIPSSWTAYTPTFTGFGTAASVNFVYRRVGDSIDIVGSFVTGTTTATEARITLPTNLTSDTAKIPVIGIYGQWAKSDTVAEGTMVLVEPTVTYMTFGAQSASTGGTAKQNGNGIIGNTVTMKLMARGIPIANWEG